MIDNIPTESICKYCLVKLPDGTGKYIYPFRRYLFGVCDDCDDISEVPEAPYSKPVRVKKNPKTPEDHRKRKHKWYLDNKNKNRAAGHRRRARLLNLPDAFNDGDADFALEYWNWKCAYCRKSLIQLDMFVGVLMHFDHFIPLDDPRPDNPGTVPTNMLPSCSKCNSQKHDIDPVKWVNKRFGDRKAKIILKRIDRYFCHLTSG